MRELDEHRRLERRDELAVATGPVGAGVARLRNAHHAAEHHQRIRRDDCYESEPTEALRGRLQRAYRPKHHYLCSGAPVRVPIDCDARYKRTIAGATRSRKSLRD